MTIADGRRSLCILTPVRCAITSWTSPPPGVRRTIRRLRQKQYTHFIEQRPEHVDKTDQYHTQLFAHSAFTSLRPPMTTATLAGSTGLVGSHILSTLTTHPSITDIHAYARRSLPTTTQPGNKLHPIIDSDTTAWPTKFPSNASLFLSALGTTRAAAGGLAQQRKVDHDLPVSLARAAIANGCRTFVLISSAGSNANSWLAYPRMKGETEQAVSEMGFEHVVILRPGLIVGTREDKRPAEFALRKLAALTGSVANGFKDFWAQDAEVIARAAVGAGLMCASGKVEKKVWILEQSDIVRLGRTEWGKVSSTD